MPEAQPLTLQVQAASKLLDHCTPAPCAWVDSTQLQNILGLTTTNAPTNSEVEYLSSIFLCCHHQRQYREAHRAKPATAQAQAQDCSAQALPPF